MRRRCRSIRHVACQVGLPSITWRAIGDWQVSWGNGAMLRTPTIVPGLNGQALQLNYNLGTAKGAWVQLRRDYNSGLDISGGDHLRFYYRGTTTNTLEVGLTSRDAENYFASSWNSVTQVPWWTYATWDYRDFLKGDQQPFPDFGDVRAIYISVANKDGDVGGVGSLIIDELQYLNVATRTVPSDFEPVTVPPTVTQKAAAWVAARQQPSGLLQSWQEEYPQDPEGLRLAVRPGAGPHRAVRDRLVEGQSACQCLAHPAEPGRFMVRRLSFYDHDASRPR